MENIQFIILTQIKENRRADKVSAGPQSHILEGITFDEANKLKDTSIPRPGPGKFLFKFSRIFNKLELFSGDHVVLMGAASKGIIQRGYQHNATVYKTPYAKNPFDSVTDDELKEYKRSVDRKRHGDCKFFKLKF